MVTPAPVKPLTGPLKTAVKLIGEALVGSAWPTAWLIVTVGGVASKLTLLSVLVEAVFRLPAASCAFPAGRRDTTGSGVWSSDVGSSDLLGPPVTVTVLVPPAVPEIVTPAPLKPLTGPLKTAVKRSEERRVGKEWRSRWLMDT